MQTTKVEIAGFDPASTKVQSEAEKISLLIRMKEGDSSARESLIRGNVKLVLAVIARFQYRGESADDLFQVGMIGLMKAIDHFDVTLGVRFSTYAVPMIAGEVRRYLRDYSPMRISRSLKDLAYQAMLVRERLTLRDHREPTVDEITAALGLPRQNVVMALESVVEPVSLYEPIYSDGGDPVYVMDQIGDPNGEQDWLDELVLRDALKNLGERDRTILSRRFLKGETQVEVAKAIGISQAQVSRLEKAALAQIKALLAP